MHSKNTLALNQVTPSKAKNRTQIRTLILLFKPTTNLITPLAYTLEKPDLIIHR